LELGGGAPAAGGALLEQAEGVVVDGDVEVLQLGFLHRGGDRDGRGVGGEVHVLGGLDDGGGVGPLVGVEGDVGLGAHGAGRLELGGAGPGEQVGRGRGLRLRLGGGAGGGGGGLHGGAGRGRGGLHGGGGDVGGGGDR